MERDRGNLHLFVWRTGLSCSCFIPCDDLTDGMSKWVSVITAPCEVRCLETSCVSHLQGVKSCSGQSIDSENVFGRGNCM